MVCAAAAICRASASINPEQELLVNEIAFKHSQHHEAENNIADGNNHETYAGVAEKESALAAAPERS